MTRPREHHDDYAETQVLHAPRPLPSGSDDALALYEEYARDVAREAQAATQPKSRARRKR